MHVCTYASSMHMYDVKQARSQGGVEGVGRSPPLHRQVVRLLGDYSCLGFPGLVRAIAARSTRGRRLTSVIVGGVTSRMCVSIPGPLTGQTDPPLLETWLRACKGMDVGPHCYQVTHCDENVSLHPPYI